MTVNQKEIGERLAAIRKSRHMTQDAVAEHLGITVKHVSHVERGISSYSISALADFCELFDVSLDYIVFGRSNDALLSRLPKSLLDFLNTSDEIEIEKLRKYLALYCELKS